MTHVLKIEDFVGESELTQTIASSSGNGKNKRLNAVIHLKVNENNMSDTFTDFQVVVNGVIEFSTFNINEAIKSYNSYQ